MMKKLKDFVVGMPVAGPALRSVYSKVFGRKPLVFERSDQYWEDRYRRGGTSGSGSYGRLAAFKAEFLNNFVELHQISSIVEFGCGDGAQLELAVYPQYIGFDVAPTSVNFCREKFAGKSEYSFHLVGSTEYSDIEPVDLALSLDVIYHLVEDEVFDKYMHKLFSSSKKFVIIYAYNFEKIYASRHERGRNFTAWVLRNTPNWELVSQVPNRYPYDVSEPENTSQSNFFVFEKRIKG
ncbi:MAG: methyltransferase domain-containing protein [Desulfococcaceae bacterium]